MVPQRVAISTNVFDALVDVLQVIDAKHDNLSDLFPANIVRKELMDVRKPVADLVNEMRAKGMSGERYR